MAVVIAQCISGYFAYEYDYSFNKIHQNHASIYRVGAVREFENILTPYGYAPFPLGDLVDKTFPDVNQSSLFFHSRSNFKLGDDLFPANINYVDPEFFQLFSFDFRSGNP